MQAMLNPYCDSRSARRFWPCLLIFGWLLTTSVGSAQETKPAAATESTAQPATSAPLVPELPWEYRPYDILVWIGAPSSAQVDAAVLQQIERDILQLSESSVGAPWRLTVAQPPANLESTIAYEPSIISDTDITAANKEALKQDKIVLVSIQGESVDTTVQVRQLDTHARAWSHMLERSVRQPSLLSYVVFDAIVETFAPLARIEDGQGSTCTARIRAGGLVESPDSLAWINLHDVLQPTFRQNDRYGEPLKNRVQVLPFTFLEVESRNELNPSVLNCVVHSSMRGPIRGRSTSRRERWALKVRPWHPQTELIIESKPVVRNEPKIPLAGMEIYSKIPAPEPTGASAEEKAAAEKRNPPELLGLTDWRGSLTVASREPGLRILYVKNGGLLLARLPMVPGLTARLVAEVPDDNPRLQTEGFVKGMNGEITDLVVQRQLIKARVRKRIAEGKIDEAQKYLDEFRGLKTLNDLQRMLDQQMTRQRPTNHNGVKERIEKLYSDQRTLMAKYIDVELLNQLTLEVAEARRNPPQPAVEEEPTVDVTKPDPPPDEKAKKGLPAALQKSG